MGGAASLLGAKPLDVDALILEEVYPTIEKAVTNRLAIRIGNLAPLVSGLFYQQIPYRLDLPLAALRPVDAIKNNHAPVFVIGGSEDRHTPAAETQWLYANASNPKQIWIVQGAAHQDFYQFAGVIYERKILAFLQKYF